MDNIVECAYNVDYSAEEEKVKMPKSKCIGKDVIILVRWRKEGKVSS